MSEQDKQSEDHTKSSSEKFGAAGGMGMGMSIGLSFGVAIGMALDNLAIGMAIGIGFGVALGAAFIQENDEHEDGATWGSAPESGSETDRN